VNYNNTDLTLNSFHQIAGGLEEAKPIELQVALE
jgi:hypothetical protein